MKEIRLNGGLSYRTYPHKCEPGALDFKIAEFSLDGGEPVEPERDGLVDLQEYPGWSVLKIKLEIRVPDGLLGKVFPEYDDIPGMLFVAAHCRATYSRERYVLSEAPIGSGTYSKEVEIRSEDVRHSITFRPFLIRDKDATGFQFENYAADAGVFVADGDEWYLDISAREDGDDHVLDVRKRKFSKEEDDSRFPPEERMYFLDLEADPTKPVLWLNEDHHRVTELMWNGESQYDRLTEELIWDQVMTPVWTRLLTVAASEYDTDSDEWTREWHEAVFEQMHEYIYEDDFTPEKTAEQLQSDLQDGVIKATKHIEDAVQAFLDPATHYTKHIQTYSE